MFEIKRYEISNENLKRWIKFIWHFEADSIDVYHKILPMDSVDIVVNLGADIIYETKTDKMIAPRLHVNGLRDGHSYIRQNERIDVWGISFCSFGLYPFVNKPLGKIKNEIVDLKDLSVSLACKLESLAKSNDSLSIIHQIEGLLESELKLNDRIIDMATIIEKFFINNDVSISSFCIEYKVNQKRFERAVINMTGFTPINLRRIRRYMMASNQLLFNKSANITDIAYDYNYTDQAYFTKECSRFSGVSPRIFRNEKDTVIENSIYI